MYPTASDVIHNVLSLIIMALAGLIVGWRIHNGIGSALLGFGLLLLFAYPISWVMAYVGLLVPSVEVVQNASSMVIFPLTFIANTFVPAENLPTALRVFAEWNPVSAVTQAAREFFDQHPTGDTETERVAATDRGALHPVWVVIIIGVFAPLAVSRYRKAAAI